MAPYAPWSSDRSPRSPLRRQRWGLRLRRGGPVGPCLSAIRYSGQVSPRRYAPFRPYHSPPGETISWRLRGAEVLRRLGWPGFLVIGLVAGSAVGVTVAWAAFPFHPTPSTITACYPTSGLVEGQLRFIDYQHGARCHVNEAMLTVAAEHPWRGARGARRSSTRANDVVRYNGSAYVALQENTNVTPADGIGVGAAWCERGADGTPGANGCGAKGATGKPGPEGRGRRRRVIDPSADRRPDGRDRAPAGATGAAGPAGPTSAIPVSDGHARPCRARRSAWRPPSSSSRRCAGTCARSAHRVAAVQLGLPTAWPTTATTSGSRTSTRARSRSIDAVEHEHRSRTREPRLQRRVRSASRSTAPTSGSRTTTRSTVSRINPTTGSRHRRP